MSDILVNINKLGQDYVSKGNEYYEQVKDWNVWKVEISDKPLAYISKWRSGKIGISFTILEKSDITRRLGTTTVELPVDPNVRNVSEIETDLAEEVLIIVADINAKVNILDKETVKSVDNILPDVKGNVQIDIDKKANKFINVDNSEMDLVNVYDLTNTKANQVDLEALGNKNNLKLDKDFSVYDKTSILADSDYLIVNINQIPRKIWFSDLKILIATQTGLEIKIVETFEEMVLNNVIYFIQAENADNKNVYDEYLLIDGVPEKIGSTDIDLTDILNDIANIKTEKLDKVEFNDKGIISIVLNETDKILTANSTNGAVNIIPFDYVKYEPNQLGMALGEGAESGNKYGTATGRGAKTKWGAQSAFGYQASALGDYTSAFGFATEASHLFASAFGHAAKAKAEYATSIGPVENTTPYSVKFYPLQDIYSPKTPTIAEHVANKQYVDQNLMLKADINKVSIRLAGDLEANITGLEEDDFNKIVQNGFFELILERFSKKSKLTATAENIYQTNGKKWSVPSSGDYLYRPNNKTALLEGAQPLPVPAVVRFDVVRSGKDNQGRNAILGKSNFIFSQRYLEANVVVANFDNPINMNGPLVSYKHATFPPFKIGERLNIGATTENGQKNYMLGGSIKSVLDKGLRSKKTTHLRFRLEIGNIIIRTNNIKITMLLSDGHTAAATSATVQVDIGR